MTNDFLPPELEYDKGYSWIKKQEDHVMIGVTKIFTSAVKELVFVDLPKIGPIKIGQTYISLESIKWSGHVDSPVTGEIIEVNSKLFDQPKQINEDPYTAWIMKVKVSASEELMDAEKKLATSTCKI